MTGDSGGPAGRLAGYFLESKLTPLIAAVAVAVGVFSVMRTPSEEEPQIVVPLVDVFVGLPGAEPQEVESRVTLPLEKRMAEIPGVEYVYSTSMTDRAMVAVRFEVGEDVERSLVKLHDKLALVRPELPADASPPVVRQRTIDDVPVLGLTLWSRRYDGAELRAIARELARELAALEDVSVVDIIGGPSRELSVALDPARLAALGLDPASVADAVAAHDAAAPAGSYESGDVSFRVDTEAPFATVRQLEQLVVAVHDGRSVRLTDVATVRDGAAEIEDYVLFMGGVAASEAGLPDSAVGSAAPAVTLSLAKRHGADASRVVDRALRLVEERRRRLIPGDVEVTVTRNYGETAREKAGELLTHLMVAIVSVTIVIGLFLGWRGGVVVFVSVPVTFALTLFVYHLFDYTLNRVTLFALIFVTGIVVDDSIIVVDNIVRHFAMRHERSVREAIAAVAEVGNPTILATLTVIASVLPMAFVGGLMGPYMAPMPVGATLAMTFSLFVALIVSPWLAYRLLRRGRLHDAGAEEGAGPQTRGHRLYARIVTPLIEKPILGRAFLGFVFLLLVGAMVLLPLKAVTVKMLPFDNKSELQIIVDMPEGTTLERTGAVARELAAALATVPEVTHIEIYAGTASPINFNGLVRHYDLRKGPHVGDLHVHFVHKSRRDDRSHDLAKRIRPRVVEVAARHGASAKIAEIPPGPPVMATLVAEVYGPTEDDRRRLASSMLELFGETEGVVDADWLVEAPRPRVSFAIDREKATLHGVDPRRIARVLRVALDGESPRLLRDAGAAEPVPVRLRLPRADRSGVDELASVRVRASDGSLVPLLELLRPREGDEPASLHRKNLRPLVYVTGDVAGRQESPVYAIFGMGDEVRERTRQAIAAGSSGPRSPGADPQLNVVWDGEWQITVEVFRDLGIAFGIVLLLIYVLIVGWFRSFRVPLVMMVAIPLSLVGILPGHALLGAFFTATSMIGFIALAGIMVRNSVLLIDFAELSMARGATLAEAVVAAGAVRMRPILLTAGTVVVGAFVILFDPIFEGLAISLMFGAMASTFLTLVVVPLVYYGVERRRSERLSLQGERRRPGAAAPDPGR